MRFNFDRFVLDTSARELRTSTGPVHLSPKAFELLQLLLEQRPGAMSKAELHARLWGGTFVTDTSLAMLVSEVRGALGDEPRRPRYIRTVHAYGYAFCGTAVASAEPSDAAGCWLEWEGRRYPLAGAENIIGRAPGSTVAIDLPEVSRRHAQIAITAAGATVEDLGSRNGTFVGGVRIDRATRLADGDDIGVGPATLRFHVAVGDATTRTFLPAENRLLKKP